MAKDVPPYKIYLEWSPEDRAWIAEVPDLPGCMADGETQEEAIREAKKVIRLWLGVAEEEGRDIPEPTAGPEPSGRFITRIPKSLHRRLQVMAERENVSLNQLVLSLLSEHEAQRRSRSH